MPRIGYLSEEFEVAIALCHAHPDHVGHSIVLEGDPTACTKTTGYRPSANADGGNSTGFDVEAIETDRWRVEEHGGLVDFPDEDESDGAVPRETRPTPAGGTV